MNVGQRGGMMPSIEPYPKDSKTFDSPTNLDDSIAQSNDYENRLESLEIDIRLLGEKLGLIGDMVSKIHEQNEIQEALNLEDEVSIYDLIESGQIENSNVINEGLKILHVSNKLDKELIHELEHDQNTLFHDIGRNIDNRCSFISLVFSNFNFHAIYRHSYYYIIYQLCEYSNDNKIKKFNAKYILKQLEKIKIDFSSSDYFRVYQKFERVKGRLLVSKKQMKIFLEDNFMYILNQMYYHIESGKYLIKNPFDILIYDYFPSPSLIAIQNLSRSKYSIFKLELNILEVLKAKYFTFKTTYDIKNDLLVNRRSIILQMIYDYELEDSKATRHIMNLFHKNFGRESLYEAISEEINNIIDHINDERNSNDVNLKALKQFYEL